MTTKQSEKSIIRILFEGLLDGLTFILYFLTLATLIVFVINKQNYQDIKIPTKIEKSIINTQKSAGTIKNKIEKSIVSIPNEKSNL